MKTQTRRTGFTLIELLVVVAVIAILVAVLLPALQGVRNAAQKAQSASNLRQLLIVKTNYAEDDKRGRFPVVPFAQGFTNTRTPDDSVTFSSQDRYGGYAGFFNLRQYRASGPIGEGTVPNTADGGNLPYNSGYYFTPVRQSDGRYVWTAPSTQREDELGPYSYSRPLLEPYMEDNASYAMLQSPADDLDGGDDANGQFSSNFPPVIPDEITGQQDVIWYNISYLYIAGLTTTDGQRIGIMADEANSNDVGGGRLAAEPGTLRRNLSDADRRGYQPQDNHGTEGGHVAFTDGAVEFIRGQNEAHDLIFDTINRRQINNSGQVDESTLRSNNVMTVD